MADKETIRERVHRCWTPEREAHFNMVLAQPMTFALRHLIMSVRDLLKYDGRTREAKRAIAQGRLRLSVASDEDLKELAYLETEDEPIEFAKSLNEYKKLRDEIKKKVCRNGKALKQVY